MLFCLGLIVSPFGKTRLGGLDARPEFSTLSWFSMLFAAGMGVGLMFSSVAEPTAAPVPEPGALALVSPVSALRGAGECPDLEF